MIEKHLADTS